MAKFLIRLHKCTGSSKPWVFAYSLTGLPQSGKNIWKMKFFPGQGKVREICGWQGKFRKDLQSQGKGEFKNKWLWQAVFRKFLFCSRGERMYRYSLSPSPPHLGILLKERICSLGEQILSFKSNPQFEVIQLTPFK